MKKAYLSCSHCKKKRWGKRIQEPTTENAVDVHFDCSHCGNRTTTQSVVKASPRSLQQTSFRFANQHVWN